MIRILSSPNVPMYPRIEKKVKVGSKYSVSTKVEGIKGEKYSACFGVGTPFGKNQVKDVKIRWLNDYSENKKDINIVFEAKSDKIIIFYRFNLLTPVKSELEYNVLPIEKISIKQVSDESEECFDNPNFFVSCPSELTSDQELQLEKNIVWIFASPRSGTTWLSKNLLGSETLVFEEPRIGDHLKIKNQETKEDYVFSEKYKSVWIPYLRKLILYRIYSQFRDYKKKIIVKEPNGSVGAKTIIKCLPNSKAIFIFRDGRDVIDSKINGLSKDGWLSNFVGYTIAPKDRSEWIKSEAINWTNLTNELFEVYSLKTKDLRLSLRYEDLNEKTEETLKDIFKFLNIDIKERKISNIVEKHDIKNIPNDAKGSGKFVRSAQHEKWKESFSLEEKNILEKIMGSTLDKLGYQQDMKD